MLVITGVNVNGSIFGNSGLWLVSNGWIGVELIQLQFSRRKPGQLTCAVMRNVDVTHVTMLRFISTDCRFGLIVIVEYFDVKLAMF